MKNEICRIEMFYELIEFKNTIIKSYYQINIEVNKNTTVASNDEQMFSNENESSNDEKITDQFPKLHDTKINATTSSVITLSAIIFNTSASNAAALSAPNQTKSEKTLQLSWIKRRRNCSQKQSIIQLKDQSNLSIFLLNEIDSSISFFRTPYAESKKKKSMNY